MCFSLVNGAWPIHGTPSPPMCVNVSVRRSIQIAITWQPMPAVARLPSGTLVDVLCGQPEQKYGRRSSVIRGFASAASFALIQSTRAFSFSDCRGCRPRRSIRCAITRAIIAGVSSRERRQQPVAVRAHPFALFVELADDARPHVVAPVVELLLQLVFDDLPLFLDDQDLFQPFGELAHALRLERPRHRDLVDANADLGGVGVVDAEVVERLADVEIALAAGDDAEPRLRRIDDDPVELVDAAIGERRVDLVVLHPRFGLEEAVRPADVQTVGRQREIVGHDDLRARPDRCRPTPSSRPCRRRT